MKKVSLSFGWRPRLLAWHRAKLRRDSITVCCRFFLYDDNSLFSCQGQRKNFFFFFCQDDEDDEGYFGSSLTFVGQILFCYARFVLSSAKIFQSSDAGRGGRESLSWENNNINEHVSKCRGIFTKDNVTQPLQKTRPDYCGKWQHAIRHSCNYHLKILLLFI